MQEENRNGIEHEKTQGEVETDDTGSIGDVELGATAPDIKESETKPGLFEALRRGFERGWQTQRVARKESREERKRDKTRMLVALAAFAGVMLLMFIFVFSSPPKPPSINNPPGTPDLGRRTTPEQGGPQENVNPLMSVNPRSGEAENGGQATAEEVAHTARPVAEGTGSGETGVSPSGSPHTLADIDFKDRALEEQYAMHGSNPPAPYTPAAGQTATNTDDLKTASLVFVSAPKQEVNMHTAQPAIETNSVMDLLPVGTHLVARLEAPVSTALEAPAVAVIEYNYEQDGQTILPAGTKVIGKLRRATPQGYVSIEFNRLEFQDGTTQKISATAMGLNYEPLQGQVTGRNRGLRFLVQSLTGVGEIGAYVVGGSPGSTSVFSEDALLREQLAANAAMAGQEQFNELAATQHIIVTVPGNTRFYLVLEHGTAPQTSPASAPPAPNLPTSQELMELMELKRELAAAASQQAGSAAQEPGADSVQ